MSDYSSWAYAEIFPGGKRQHFADPCQVADDAIQMYVQETLYRFYMTTPQRKCHMLRQQSQKMRFVGSHSQVYYDNFHNRLAANFPSRVFLFTKASPWSFNKTTHNL